MRERERGSALIVVLIAILVMLPPTLILAKLAFQWQRQALDYRDILDEELVAEAGFEEARNRLAADGLSLAPNEATTFSMSAFEDYAPRVRISRQDDVVLAQDGRILTALDAKDVDLELAGVDAEGRFVYRYRKLAIFVVQIDVSRRPTLPGVRLYGVLARLPDDTFETLGLTLNRGYFESGGAAERD